MAADPLSRFPAAGVVLAYIEKAIDGELAVPGTPPARIVINGTNHRLGLRVPGNGPLPTIPPLENIAIADVFENDQRWFDLSVQVGSDPTDVYAILCGVLDRIQLEHQTFAQAVPGVLASLRHLLATGERLTRDQQVGLVGELLVLAAAMDWVGVRAAIGAWRGQNREEHDFGFSDTDVEVKTTTSETRRHVISGAGQLMPTGGRALYLLSLQLTAAGAQSGLTLESVVRRIRATAPSELAVVNRAFETAGYRDEDAAFYRTAWVLRTPPRFFLVGDAFPAITPPRLSAVVPKAELIDDIRYRVNLEGVPPSADLFPVDVTTKCDSP
jgi:hypothetical protein